MKYCECEDWKENEPIIAKAMFFCHIRPHSGVIGGLKKTFVFCPYCGIKLKEE